MKALSIVGICVHVLSFFCIAAFMESDIDAAMGWGVISAFFGIGASIYYVTQSKKKPEYYPRDDQAKDGPRFWRYHSRDL